MEKDSRILVLGYRGLIGGAIHLKLAQLGYAPRHAPGRINSLSGALATLGDAEYVFLAAGVGGGIQKNLCVPADLASDTLRLLTHVFRAAHLRRVRRLIWFACACVYPMLDRPVMEADLWAGPLEPTSRAFAAANLAGIELTRAYNQQYGTEYLALCPPTVYGPADDFSEDGHVLAAMIRKLHDAKVTGAHEVTFWGSGGQRRQFLYVEDLAEFAAQVMRVRSEAFRSLTPLLNVAGDPSYPLGDVAALVSEVVGYRGRIRWDANQPEGAPSKEIMGKRGPGVFVTPLRDGMKRTYAWYVARVLPGAGKNAAEASA